MRKESEHSDTDRAKCPPHATLRREGLAAERNSREKGAHRLMINVLGIQWYPFYTSVRVPAFGCQRAFIDGRGHRTVTVPGTSCNEEAGGGTRGQTEN